MSEGESIRMTLSKFLDIVDSVRKMKDNQHRYANTELDPFKFSSTHVPLPQCRAGCGYNVVGSKEPVIFWRDEYYHLECAFKIAIAELDALKEQVHGQ